MALMQLFLVALLGLQGMRTLLVSRGGLQLEVVEGARDSDIQELYAAIRELPFVEQVLYVPREQAYERERGRDPALIAFLEEFELENPFPDFFAVTLASLADYPEFVRFVQADQWRSVVDPSFLSSVTTQEQEMQQLLQITGAIRSATLLFLLLAFLALGCVVVELTRKRAESRGSEMFLENLLGAMPADILAPFVTEMTLLLILAIVGGSALVLVCAGLLPFIAPAVMGAGAGAEWLQELRSLLLLAFPLFVILEIVLAPGLALAGAWLGLGNLWPHKTLLRRA
jgi:cell division protein FtsX